MFILSVTWLGQLPAQQGYQSLGKLPSTIELTLHERNAQVNDGTTEWL